MRRARHNLLDKEFLKDSYLSDSVPRLS